jgi:hypothetical protein
MKKLFVIVVVAAAFAALAAVHAGWKWGGKVAISHPYDTQSDTPPDGQPAGWTWDGNSTRPPG